MQLNCSITLNASIGPDTSALQVHWIMNGTYFQANTSLRPPLKTYTDSFTSTLTVNITGYDKTGYYCCIASLAGRDGDMTDCVDITVSGISVFNFGVINGMFCFQKYQYQETTLIFKWIVQQTLHALYQEYHQRQ